MNTSVSRLSLKYFCSLSGLNSAFDVIWLNYLGRLHILSDGFRYNTYLRKNSWKHCTCKSCESYFLFAILPCRYRMYAVIFENKSACLVRRINSTSKSGIVDTFFHNICTGKSFSEELVLASTNPQCDDRLFIELRVQYVKFPSSEHVENMCCT